MSQGSLAVFLLTLFSFALTYFIEIWIILGFFKKTFPVKRIWLVVLLANGLTWPLINLFVQVSSPLWVILTAELGVCIVEAAIYLLFFRRSIGRSLLSSFIANIVSFLFGNIFSATMILFLIASIFN